MYVLKPNDIKEKLFKSINTIFSKKDEFLNNPDTAFSRLKKISFQQTMLFPMIAGSENTDIEILDFFQVGELPTQSALLYRRDQIKPEAYKELLKIFTEDLPNDEDYEGMNLIACDGSRINTPYNSKDKESFVDCIKDRKGFNQLHLNTLYDLSNDIFIDAVIQGYHSMNETKAFCEMVDRYSGKKKSIFIADRGYSSYNVVAHVILKDQYFLIRLDSVMAKNVFPDKKDLCDKSSFDVVDTIHIGRKRNKKMYELSNYHYLPARRTYDHIKPGSSETDEFQVRLLKIQINDKTTEYILTNLPADEFPAEKIKDLYKRRWGLEVAYRYLKYASGVVYLHSLKSNLIHQEIFAKLITYNFSSAVEKITKPKNRKKAKHNQELNKTYLFKVCIRFIRGTLNEISELIAKKTVPVREGRNYKRQLRTQRADTLQYR